MPGTIDNLEIKIISDSTKATASLDKFIGSLEKLSTVLANTMHQKWCIVQLKVKEIPQ